MVIVEYFTHVPTILEMCSASVAPRKTAALFSNIAKLLQRIIDCSKAHAKLMSEADPRSCCSSLKGCMYSLTDLLQGSAAAQRLGVVTGSVFVRAVEAWVETVHRDYGKCMESIYIEHDEVLA